MDRTHSHTGRLLVALPALDDPNFFRTVVLVLDHDEDGAVGVVLNRPSEVELGEVLPEWALQVSGPPQLFEGGPVGTERAVGLAVLAGAESPDGFRPVAGALGVLDLDADSESLLGRLAGARVFAGYAGWSPGQLEAEIASGAWVVVDARPDDLLTEQPGGLWRSVLKRQPGRLAWLAGYPADPEMN